MVRIFVDCTYSVATRGDRGIARVVRNIVRQAPAHPLVFPVVFAGGAFRAVPSTVLQAPSLAVARGRLASAPFVLSCVGALISLAGLLPAALGDPLLGKTVYNRRLRPQSMRKLGRACGARLASHEDPVLHAASNPGGGWAGSDRSARSSGPTSGDGFSVCDDSSGCRDAAIEFAAGDVIFFPDASWNVDYAGALARLRERGVRIVLLCHDLLPLTHKHLCPDPLEVFGHWLCEWLPQADGVICNSRSTRDQLSRFVESRGTTLRRNCWIEASLLGGDFIATKRGGDADTSAAQGMALPIATDEPYYLTVGAIEPRKNHALLLRALERFWQEGGSTRSVWVGRWTMDSLPLRRRVLGNCEYGRRLLLLGDLPDAALAALYARARAAVLPSLGEGFGLPAAEALFLGCPVIASDIAPHREVCGDKAIYFDPDDATSLAGTLLRLERGEQVLPGVSAGAGLTWQRSVAQMFELIRRRCDAG